MSSYWEPASALSALTWYNVKEYGALGNGVANDYASINNAITAVMANATGGVLYFPPGTYLVGTSVTLSDPSGLREILVMGYGATITTTATAIYAMTISGVLGNFGGITVQGLHFAQGGLANVLGAILAENSEQVRLRDLTFHADGTSASYKAIHIRNSAASNNNTGCFWGRIDNIYMRRSSASDIPIGILMEGGANAWLVNSARISNCTQAILIRNQSAASNSDPNAITVFSCYFENTGTAVTIDDTGKLNGLCTAMIRVLDCRYEGAAQNILTLVGMTGNATNGYAGWNPYIAGSKIISSLAYITAPAGIVVTSQDVGYSAAPVSATGKACVSRYIANALLNVSNAVATTYVDFGGTFTTAVTTLANDQVCIRVQSVVRKQVGGFADIVVDRSGTKLPAVGGSSSVEVAAVGVVFPFELEIWDAPAAGTYTYKPQIYTSDANSADVGMGVRCQFVVEVWR